MDTYGTMSKVYMRVRSVSPGLGDVLAGAYDSLGYPLLKLGIKIGKLKNLYRRGGRIEKCAGGYLASYHGTKFFIKRLSEVSPFVTKFVEPSYMSLDVKGKTVLNVGAGLGDTTLSFIKRGAKRVISLEPFPYSFEIMRKNVELNGVQDKAILLNAAMGGKIGKLRIDENYVNSPGDDAKNFAHGKTVPMLTLSYLVKKYKIKNGVIKSNCEGGEYGMVGSATTNELRAFNQMEIMCHHGAKPIEEKLKRAGFSTKITAEKVECEHRDSHPDRLSSGLTAIRNKRK